VEESGHPRIDVLEPPASFDRVEALALVLHGGREHSRAAVQPGQLAVRRMRPFARDLALAGRDHGVAVWSLQYRMRGWNDDDRSPVGDARWALDQVAEHHGEIPVVLVGHSMGGRTAVNVADHPLVVGLAALAPWLPSGEPHRQVAGRSVLVVHGRHDTVTSPAGSLAWARAAATVTERLWRVEVRRERHAMLWRAAFWHALTTEFALSTLGVAPLPALLAAAPAGSRLQITV
jgi:pimeloyl-ACP methyl ester carboxylesterase